MNAKTTKYLLIFVLLFIFAFFVFGCAGSSGGSGGAREISSPAGASDRPPATSPVSEAPVNTNVNNNDNNSDNAYTGNNNNNNNNNNDNDNDNNNDNDNDNDNDDTPVYKRKSIALWCQNDNSEGSIRTHIYAREHTEGSNWEGLNSAPIRIDDNLATESGASRDAQIAFDSSGNAIAVWRQMDDSQGKYKCHIYARRYSVADGWQDLNSAPTRIDANLPTESESSFLPQIAFDPSGNAIAVWQQTDRSMGVDRSHIYARRYLKGRGWENIGLEATRIDANLPQETGSSSYAQIAFDSSGNAIVIWRQADNTSGKNRCHIYSRRYIAGAGWENIGSSPTRIDGNLSTEAGDSSYPQIYFDAGGNAMALWAQKDTSSGAIRQHIYSRRYIAGLGWENLDSAATRVDANLAIEAGDSAYPKLAFNSSGNAIAIWQQMDASENGARFHIYARRYIAGAGWKNLNSVATRIDDNLTTEAGNSFYPQIAFDSSGNAIAVWSQEDNVSGVTRQHIYARKYLSDSGWEALYSAATRVDDNLAQESGSSFEPQITFDSLGNALTVWQQTDNSEGSNRAHIYARRYVTGQGWENADSAPIRIDDNLPQEAEGSLGARYTCPK